MQSSRSIRAFTLVTCAALLVGLEVWPAHAQEATSVAGKWTATQVKRDTTKVGDLGDRVFSVSTSVATNANTGKTEFLDGAAVINVTLADLVQGSGPQQGYVVLTLGGNSATCSYEGQVSTAPGKDGPVISFQGTFTWTKGSGKYAGIVGKGTYRGQYTSQTTYDVEWTGEFTIPK